MKSNGSAQLKRKIHNGVDTISLFLMGFNGVFTAIALSRAGSKSASGGKSSLISHVIDREGVIQVVETEGCMSVRMAGTVAHLEGDWTMTGVTDNVDSVLRSLCQLESQGKKSFQINCGQIAETDTSGLQLLYVWVKCARLRGIEPKLVNVTDGMQQAMCTFGVRHFGGSFS